MAGRFHTLSVPVSPLAVRNFVYPPQDPATERTLGLNCGAWLADCGATLTGALVQADESLTCLGYFINTAAGATIVDFIITGGTPGTSGIVEITLLLSTSDIENISVSIPIVALTLPNAPVSAPPLVTAGGVPVTAGGSYVIGQ